MTLAADLLNDYPLAVVVDQNLVRRELEAAGRVVVVLDDDPTGTQSAPGMPVLLGWSAEDIAWGLNQRTNAVYLSTNSRSLEPDRAVSRVSQVVRTVLQVAERLGRNLVFASRGDSTLRGHFPRESAAIMAELDAAGTPADGLLFIPAFPEAGRLTVGGTHWVRRGDLLVPVSETEFAVDPTFAYTSSDLREYVAEKSGGDVSAAEVELISLTIVRAGPQAVAAALMGVRGGRTAVIDATEESDLVVIAAGIGRAERDGARFVYQIGPPFVRARIGQKVSPPLSGSPALEAARRSPEPGLVVLGSHVGRTSRQWEVLCRAHDVAAVELLPTLILNPSTRTAHCDELVERLVSSNAELIALTTSRTVARAETRREELHIARMVSSAVSEVVRRVVAHRDVAFVLAKGGITSHDVAAHGLGMSRAVTLGTMLPGIVPVWLPLDGALSGVPYVVFPGNVGDDAALATVVGMLRARWDRSLGEGGTAPRSRLN